MMPILHFPGEMIPGQLGPIRRELECFNFSQTRTMSSVGMPSVMQTISGMPASSASRIASAANGGGTKMTVAFAPVFSTACRTVSNTGQPSWVVPPLPGVTPPTTLVPYSAQPLAWKVPSRPVIPCTIKRVFLSTKTLMLLLCRRDQGTGIRKLHLYDFRVLLRTSGFCSEKTAPVNKEHRAVLSVLCSLFPTPYLQTLDDCSDHFANLM